MDSLKIENLIISKNNNTNEITLKIFEFNKNGNTNSIVYYDIEENTINLDSLTLGKVAFIYGRGVDLDDCVIITYSPCNGVGNADGHAETTNCTGSATTLDFSNCFSTVGGGGVESEGGSYGSTTGYDDTSYNAGGTSTTSSTNPDGAISIIDLPSDLVITLNMLLGITLDRNQEFWVDQNFEQANQIIAFLEENPNSQEVTNAILNVINSLINDSEDNYVGREEGYPFNWWLDENFILNSGNFDMPFDNPNITPDEQPNAKEIVLFAIFRTAAIQHMQNSLTASNRANVLSLTFSDGINGIHNGKSDAFRHSYWNALGTAEFGTTIMELFATAHEWDSPALQETDMDLFNNNIGRNISINNNYDFFTSSSVISDAVQQEVLDGSMKYIDGNGNLVFTNQ